MSEPEPAPEPEKEQEQEPKLFESRSRSGNKKFWLHNTVRNSPLWTMRGVATLRNKQDGEYQLSGV